MPWPIPTLTTIERPHPIPLLKWLPVLLAVAATIVAAVLTLWPTGKSTQTATFWVLLIGAPACACGLLFGWRLNQWESEQLIAEESEQERARIELLWHDWSRRHVTVSHAAAFLPQAIEVTGLGNQDAEAPVNVSRSIGFDWAADKLREHERTNLLDLIVDRFRGRLTGLSEAEIVLVLDETSIAEPEAWKSEVAQIFGEAIVNVEFNVDISSNLDCAAWLEEYIDSVDTPARLVIAAQLWHDNVHQIFSEGAAAILFVPRITGVEEGTRTSTSVEGYVLRPMTTAEETLKQNLAQLAALQVAPDKLTNVWFSGCSEALSVAATGSLKSLQKEKLQDCEIDHVLGNPGPISGWIALATALEIARHNPGKQLVAWSEAGKSTMQLFVVAPGQSEGN